MHFGKSLRFDSFLHGNFITHEQLPDLAGREQFYTIQRIPLHN